MSLFFGNIQQLGIAFPTSGLTSYWRFDEEGGTIAYDAKGSRNMTATAGATVSVSGISENCRDFDGSTGKLYTDNDVFNNAEVVSGSISAWFKSNTTPSGEDAIIFSIEGWASILLQNGTGYIRVLTDGSNYTNGSVDLTDGSWHHIVLTWNASGNIHYIDGGTGVSGTATKSPTPDLTSGRATTIGRLFQDSREFTGLIDEVGVWSNRELSQAEVTALYNSGAGRFLPILPYLWTGLTSYWRFDETSGTVAADSKSTNNLTLTNTSHYASGKNNYALDFTVNSSKAVLSDTSKLNYDGDESFSFSLWYKSVNAADENNFFITKQIGGPPYTGYNFLIRSWNTIEFGITDSSSRRIQISYENYSYSTDWVHLVISYDGGGIADGMKIYQNGSLINTSISDVDTIVTTTNTAKFSIGNWDLHDDRSASGYIDEVGSWNRELSQAEVTALYNGGNGKFY